MELPIALDTALRALLSCHSVYSWKIAAEGQNPTVILRLRPATQQSVYQNGVRADTVAFRRKTSCQINRDRRRAEQFRQRKDNTEIMFDADMRAVNERENTVDYEHEPNTEIIDKAPSEIQNLNKKGDSGGLHSTTSTDSVTVHAARGGEAETKTESAAGNDADHGSDLETDTESDTNTDTGTNVSETCEQHIDAAARDLIQNAKRLRLNQDLLRKENRNDNFNRVEKLQYYCVAPRMWLQRAT